ncbi:MAG: hypothetical protein AAGE13_11285 [Pseudomonadota bacterium]
MNRPIVPRPATLLAAAAFAVLAAPGLLAAEAEALPASAPETAQTGPDCVCRDTSGDEVEVGRLACLTINGREFTALCDMARGQNNTIWRRQHDGCASQPMSFNGGGVLAISGG